MGASILGLAACGTIMQGSKQGIAISSTPSGARLFVDGQEAGITPAIYQMPRKGTHVVRIEMDGYQPYELPITRSVSGWVAGNLVFGGLIGLAVDASTGGMYKLSPDQVTATLQPVRAASDGQGGAIQVVMVQQASPLWEKVGQLQPE
ncbi:PEGA domain-containing protein [Longimicrobium terrae]|uniref:PEGA domain-containing protein n=1 Tax=Longimicrobium terrae TaxID=1639882 RepID=UPI0014744FD0|nr:PEGA domain-containing protein [Longimicrobium terrae]